ncbi:hypothetical protein QUF74_19215 [Candidatus Halobeggiatoa sp. HSG11]|nr:hypothetical protein [Candidatus Halobeggiatoa sp. HSG11]
MPDGIRQSTASHILLEFKYTQSISNDVVVQSLAYDLLYRNSKKLTADEVQTFLVSAIKPQEETRKAYGYENERYPGVYESHNQLEKRVQLISLNKLADKPHNAAFKIFATHQREKYKAFKLLEQSRDVTSIPEELELLLSGLLTLGEQNMDYKLTPEQIKEVGKIWGKAHLSRMSLEERLKGLKPEERLMGLKPEERLAGLSISEVEELAEYIKKLKQEG